MIGLHGKEGEMKMMVQTLKSVERIVQEGNILEISCWWLLTVGLFRSIIYCHGIYKTPNIQIKLWPLLVSFSLYWTGYSHVLVVFCLWYPDSNNHHIFFFTKISKISGNFEGLYGVIHTLEYTLHFFVIKKIFFFLFTLGDVLNFESINSPIS